MTLQGGGDGEADNIMARQKRKEGKKGGRMWWHRLRDIHADDRLDRLHLGA
jgi:hypothetical protein